MRRLTPSERALLTVVLALTLCAFSLAAPTPSHAAPAHAGGSPLAASGWVDLSGDTLNVSVLSSGPERTVLEITVGGFAIAPVAIDGEIWYRIILPGEANSLEKGLPALPDIRRSVIIPDDRRMQVTLLDAEYHDFPDLPVAPSKGNLPRTVDPDSVPPSFAPFYSSDAVWPAAAVEGQSPYILRDFRGMVVDANAFQYFAASRTLRVYTRMRIEIAAAGPDDVNVFDRSASAAKLDPQFARLYRSHFLNFPRERYEPALEDGGLLIIAYDAFLPQVEPLLQWKLQKGMPARLVPLSAAGSNPTEIKEYIRGQYQNENIAYVLLVGDAEQVPTFIYPEGGADPPGGADPMYAMLSGLDFYPDIFIGRFSAETEAQVATQVERTVAYERDVAAGETWPAFGTGIASDNGPGHHDEYDFEHMNLIRDDLLAYGYTEVDTIYEPNAEAWMVTEALESGRGIIDYIGHGSTVGWGTSGFDTSEVNDLTNAGMLPFVHSVACRVGKFDNWTCFAEVWLRATYEGRPTGALATYMSSTVQDWDPPMSAQDETIDLLVAEADRTVGGLCFNGACRMLDEYGSEAMSEILTWNIFGDPSALVRTRATEGLTAVHRDTLFLGQSEYPVTIPGVGSALCALYGDSIAYGAARTDTLGEAVIAMGSPPLVPTPMLLTVTAPNKAALIENVLVIPTSGPCLNVVGVEYTDSNGDSVLNAGETVSMRVRLRNDGLDPATSIHARMSCASQFIDIISDGSAFPDLESGTEGWSESAYEFVIAPDCPDGHPMHMPLTFMTNQGPLWDCAIDFVVHAPGVSVAGTSVDDTMGGDGNGTPDPGETFALTVTLANAGSYTLNDLHAVLSCGHPMVQVLSGESECPPIEAYGNEDLAPPFIVAIDAGYPLHRAFFQLTLTGSNGYERVLDLPVRVGEFFEDVESGAGEWQHGAIADGFTDQWHISTRRNHTPGGNASWKCGDEGLGTYAPFLDAGLTTPPLEIGPGASLSFWHWISAETALTWPDSAFDGGLVEMSLDGGPFEQLTPVGGYPYRIKQRPNPADRGPFATGTPVFCGSFDWRPVTIELGNVYGSAIFRFRFGSDVTGGREGWFVDDIEVIGLGTPSGADDAAVTSLFLRQNAPNPFGVETRITFAAPREADARLQVFDACGRLVRTLIDGQVSAGLHVIAWRGEDEAGRTLPSGVYYCRLSMGDIELRRPMIRLQ